MPKHDVVESNKASAPVAPGGYARKSTGLVRQITSLDQIAFNAASASPIGLALTFTLIAIVAFPRGNPYIALIFAIALGIPVWVMFALMSSAMPRIGGDYTFNTRVLHPMVGLAGNLSVFLSTAVAIGLWAWSFTTLGVSSVLHVIGSVNRSSTLLSWASATDGHRHGIAFLISLVALLTTALLAAKGTRTVVRTMTYLFLIAAVGFVVDMIIIAFTSRSGFQSAVNSNVGPNTYHKTLVAAKGSGILLSEGGYSTRDTVGLIYNMASATLWTWWGTYMSAEFKRAGNRTRQLSTMVGSGVGQGLILLIAMVVFLHTVGYNFLASAESGNIPGLLTGFQYFGAIATGSAAVATVAALLFMGAFLPGLYINQAMVERGLFTWSFEGLAPAKLADVNDRTHAPIVAISVTFLVGLITTAWISFSPSYFRAAAVMQMFAFMPVALVGVSAAAMKWRRPDLYEGSSAQWRIGRFEVLPIAGAISVFSGLFFLGLIYYFHKNLSLTGGYFVAAVLAPFAVLTVAVIWYRIARVVRARGGVDLSLNYKSIPPD